MARDRFQWQVRRVGSRLTILHSGLMPSNLLLNQLEPVVLAVHSVQSTFHETQCIGGQFERAAGGTIRR